MMNRQANILLVEDNEGDIELLKIAFEQADMTSHLSVVHDGVEALDYILGRGMFTAATIPDIILLDLNMPRMDGKEFLNIIKQDKALLCIPVIVFTSSKAHKDIIESYKCHANSYIIKPFGLQEYIEVAKQIERFWITVAQLPERNVKSLL